ncbi:LysR family substrate-binding domain-containing protein [Streptomyces sp. MUM 2J]|nr:LysR family substrate-binding domain-containing protein [Streptomyces sp. MUM 2J]MCH0562428.1 LysR family substrate-binding domain-containing protein [Streptomyces sp. MUM 2J]
MAGAFDAPSFTLAYVPGVMPAKWARIWHERRPDVPLTLLKVPAAETPEVLRTGRADAGLVRLPVDRAVFSAIPLYTETTVVVVPRDHVATAADEVTLADLADEVVFHPLDDVLGWERPPGEPGFERPATTQDAVELVAAGVGLLYVPQSLARLFHRKDLTYRPVTDAPRSSVALSWPEEATTDLVEDFIGVVRGRTVNSTRGRRPQTPADQPERERRESSGRAAGQAGRSGQPGKTGKTARQTGGRASGRSGGQTQRGRSASARSTGRRGTGRPRRRS